jgi:hypothetical protein
LELALAIGFGSDLAKICLWLASGNFLPNQCHSVQNPQIPTWTCAVASHWRFAEFVAKFWMLLPFAEFVATCKKTVQVPFPHPTPTNKLHTTNNTMTEYSTSAATAMDTAANATGGSTTKNEVDIGNIEDNLEDYSKNKASDNDNGTEGALFRAARDIKNRMSCHIKMAGMEDCHFHIFCV